MNMDDRPMTFDETFRAIGQGDWRVLLAFSLECLFMASPAIILCGALWLSRS